MTEVQAFRFEDDGETPNNPRLAAARLSQQPSRWSARRIRAVPFERAFAAHGWGDG